MEVSRLIFTKETKKKMEKGISPQEKGRLRWERLKEAETSGLLQKAKTRADIGKIVGIENYQTAYSWVSSMVSKKALIETVVGFDGLRAIYEYRLGTPLKYDNGHKKQRSEQVAQVVKEAKRQGLIKDEMPVRERGRILFDKLKELEETGDLAKANCRADVATLVGYSEDEAKAGYSWVSNMVARKHLAEKTIGLSPSGKIMYSYSLTGSEPLYNYEEARNYKTKKIENQKVWAEENKSVIKKESPIKIKISKGDITFELELSDIERTGELIKTILKGDA